MLFASAHRSALVNGDAVASRAGFMEPTKRDESFPRALRILQRRDYLRMQRVGSRGQTEALVVISRYAAEGRGRVGLTVSRKVGNAVTRNLIKRRLRHLLRTEKELFHDRELVVVVRPSAAVLSFDALANALREACARSEQTLKERRQRRRGPKARKPKKKLTRN